MRTSSQWVQIDVPYLKSLVKNMDMTHKQFGDFIGQGEHFMKNAVYRGVVRKSTVQLICRLCECDYARLTKQEQPKPLLADDKTIDAIVNTLIRIEDKLDELLAELT